MVQSDPKPKLSLVIPLRNEEEVFPLLIERVRTVLDHLDRSAEVWLVDDGSHDQTRHLIRQIHSHDPRFRGLFLSRRFGHQTAISVGLSHARGSHAMVLDGDLQDPPELIPSFLAKAQEGFDVVYGVRTRRRENIALRIAYFTFYRLLSRITGITMPKDSGDFALLSRRVLDHLNAMPERRRFVRGLRCYVGFPQTGLEYEREARAAGTSEYGWIRLLNLAMEGLIGFSTLPLRIATFCGLLVLLLSTLAITVHIGQAVFQGAPLFDATLQIEALFFLGGLQLLGIGIVGEYLARVYDDLRGRPSVIIEEILTDHEAPNEMRSSSPRWEKAPPRPSRKNY